MDNNESYFAFDGFNSKGYPYRINSTGEKIYPIPVMLSFKAGSELMATLVDLYELVELVEKYRQQLFPEAGEKKFRRLKKVIEGLGEAMAALYSASHEDCEDCYGNSHDNDPPYSLN